MVSCTYCQQPFLPLAGVAQQWCPYCGHENHIAVSSLASPAPVVVAVTPPAGSSSPSSGSSLPTSRREKRSKRELFGFFHSRLLGFWGASNLFRTYVTGEELIFIHLNIKHHDENLEATQLTAAMGGGGIPALITQVVMAKKREYYWKLIKSLDHASPARLVEFATEDPESFVLRVEECSSPSLEKPSAWGVLGGACKAVLRLHHTEKGQLKVQIPDFKDLRVAWPALHSIFGEDLRVGFTWRDV